MPYTADEQEIYDFIKQSLPRFLFARETDEEVWGAIVKGMHAARADVKTLFENAQILLAGIGPPDFLGLHAIDRGTSRQANETDAGLQERLRITTDLVTLPAMLAAINLVLDADGVAGTAAITECRHDRVFLRARSEDSGDSGGTFAGTAPNMKFVPADGETFRNNVAVSTASLKTQRILNPSGFAYTELEISGANTAGNDGVFEITGLEDNYVLYTNASGVAEVDAVATWFHRSMDYDGNIIDGFRSSYLSRGYRVSGDFTIVVVLPYGTTAGTAESVAGLAYKIKGAGINVVVERRVVP